MSSVKKHSIVIVGLGKTGLSCAKYLAEQGIDFAITDSRADPPGLIEARKLFPDTEISLGEFDQALLSGADEVMLSQGVPINTPAIAKCEQPIIGDIELFARKAKAPVIAITGSNGKSTVTDLLGKMAQACELDVRVGGNIGTPALELLSDCEPELYILEISNFQLQTTHSLQARVATILNVSPDHLDCYANFDEYVAAKQRVYHACQTVIINRDDELTIVQHGKPAKTASFGFNEPAAGQMGIIEKDNEIYLAQGEHCLLNVKELALKGRQNWQNALAALALGFEFGFAKQAMLDTLRSYTGLAHRCQLVTEQDGIAWYNDSKGTNVGATCAALAGLGPDVRGKIILIAGGLAKQADFSPLLPFLQRFVARVILLGEDAACLAEAFSSIDLDLIHTNTLQQAVTIAKQTATSGDVVLLSPACASFDMFKSFEQRGEVFCQTVMQELRDE